MHIGDMASASADRSAAPGRRRGFYATGGSQGSLSLMSTMNYYVVLGIREDADSDTIRSAFRALARRYHPDAGAESSTAAFRRALEAYETLSDPERRRLHDRDLRRSRVRPTNRVSGRGSAASSGDRTGDEPPPSLPSTSRPDNRFVRSRHMSPMQSALRSAGTSRTSSEGGNGSLSLLRSSNSIGGRRAISIAGHLV